MDDLARLEDEVRALHRQLAPEEDPAARYEGRDPTGSVGVVVDGSGIVRDVSIHDGWRSRLTADQLGAVVRQTTVAAAAARLAAWGGAVAQDPHWTPRREAPRQPAAELARSMADAARAIERVGDERLLAGLLAMLERFEAEIDAVSQQFTERAAEVHTGTGQGGFATAELTGTGEVVAVSYDEDWLGGADAGAIRRETCQAFGAAFQLVASHGVGQLIAGGPLGEVQRLAADPMALARALGVWT
jgi:DNA-binding protein YbaB